MALRWISTLVTAVSLAVFGTANVVTAVVSDRTIPAVANMLMIAASAVGAVLVVVAELYRRLDSRLGILSDFLVTRMEQLDTSVGDRNAGFVEGYLARSGEPGNGTVVPLAARARARTSPAPEE